jgi:hypothetical protein
VVSVNYAIEHTNLTIGIGGRVRVCAMPTRRILSAVPIAAIAVLAAIVSTAGAVTPSAPAPASGAYAIQTRHDLSGRIDQFHGSFRVNGRSVSDFHGVVQRHANSGCAVGTSVVVLGSAPINHLVDADGTDEWAVSQEANGGFIRVPITLRLRGSRRIHRSTGELRIYFPGGSDTVDGSTVYSNITFGPTVAGPACNLEFSVG